MTKASELQQGDVIAFAEGYDGPNTMAVVYDIVDESDGRPNGNVTIEFQEEVEDRNGDLCQSWWVPANQEIDVLG